MIKNFDKSEPEQDKTPTRSLFDPGAPAKHETQSSLGERVYVDGEEEETDMEALSHMMLGPNVDENVKASGKLMIAYERASMYPTKTNIKAFRDALDAVETDELRNILALQVATLVATLKQQRRGGGQSPFNF